MSEHEEHLRFWIDIMGYDELDAAFMVAIEEGVLPGDAIEAPVAGYSSSSGIP